MPKINITNTAAAALKPGATPVEYFDTRLKGFYLRVQPSGAKSFYVTWARGQRKVLGSADVLTAEQARNLAKAIIAKHYAGEDPRAEARAAKAAMTFDRFLVERYGPWAQGSMRKGDAAQKQLRSAFPDLLNKQISDITAWDAEKWRSQRMKRGHKPSSINRYLAGLRAALNKAVEWELLAANPLDTVKQAKLDKRPKVRFLTDAEIGRLLAALDEREEEMQEARTRNNAWRAERKHPLLPPVTDNLKPMIILSLHTGLRKGEVFGLDWKDIDFSNRIVTVRGDGAKSGHTRHVDLNQTAFDTLLDWKRRTGSTGLVFPGETGKRISNCENAWRALRDRAQIRGFRWHDMRHTFASMLVQRGVDLTVVRELLGHSSFEMTLRYAHLAPSQKAKAVAMLA